MLNNLFTPMQQLLNGQYVDDQKYQELQELKDIEAVENEVSELIYNKSELEWDKLLRMTAQDFINQIKL
jgi:hypothetical protein